MYTKRKADPAFRPFKEKVLQRDSYTCQFCGFQAKDFQEVINLDNNYNNNKLSNLVTACCFCTQCFFLDSVGIGDFGGGVLIYMPEVSQTSLNSFCHVLFCAMANDTGYKDSAQSLYRSLKLRSQMVDSEFGEGISRPSVFAQCALELQIPLDKVDRMLAKVRLLPSRSRFKEQIDHWASTAMQELSAVS